MKKIRAILKSVANLCKEYTATDPNEFIDYLVEII